MKRLAVVPSETIQEYIDAGYSHVWLSNYYNPCKLLDKVYLLSPNEEDSKSLLGMEVIQTKHSELKKRLKELQVDVVRAYGGKWPCDYVCNNKVSEIPVVVSVHDRRPQWLNDSIKKADIVFSVSDTVTELVLTKFKKPDKIWLLPNRVDFEIMRPIEKCGLTELAKEYPFKYKILHFIFQ